MLNRYRNGTATREEIVFLESWFDLADNADDFITTENEASFEHLKITLKDKIDVQIRHAAAPRQAPHRMPVRRWAAAAAVAAIIGATALFLVRQNAHQSARARQTAHATGVPTLRLADGTIIALDSTTTGKIAHQNGVIISKEKDGTLSYTAVPTGTSNANQQNILTTPAGVKFKIILPDGSTVWLNAASTLKYPASFGNTNRVVTLNGEAYFDIATAANRPFIVQSGSLSVEVLGTEFNIDAYPEDGLSKTTLIRGSVRVMNHRGSIVIQPGQQAVNDPDNNNRLSVINADTEKETAWTNNMFSFKNDSLQAVLRDVARWYHVTIKYSGRIPDERFSGEISRSSQLKDVLKILEINGISFEIKENVITVVNKN
ncbi:FecR domain-containing protein [Chitinophaga oryzae]|uniref:FecR domain-containing protein n=1 Tax=Chitinophaga oryzae TaxID=2725414 RepID=A0ABX6LEF5_9BACT|nr:FecR family protein [Chitinophaga oryzae]QJB38461.1 FecR domain-containing protein [Chitinophaga oryzae]